MLRLPRRGSGHLRAATRREDGQATVEFALILFPLLLLVVGVIQFGIAVSFWQDQQRLAAAGARVAVVNCGSTTWCSPSLERFLETQTLSNGNTPRATVCFEEKSGTSSSGPVALRGDAVTVYLEAPFALVPLFGVGNVALSARTTMRLEQDALNPGIRTEPICT